MTDTTYDLAPRAAALAADAAFAVGLAHAAADAAEDRDLVAATAAASAILRCALHEPPVL